MSGLRFEANRPPKPYRLCRELGSWSIYRVDDKGRRLHRVPRPRRFFDRAEEQVVVFSEPEAAMNFMARVAAGQVGGNIEFQAWLDWKLP